MFDEALGQQQWRQMIKEADDAQQQDVNLNKNHPTTKNRKKKQAEFVANKNSLSHGVPQPHNVTTLRQADALKLWHLLHPHKPVFFSKLKFMNVFSKKKTVSNTNYLQL